MNHTKIFDVVIKGKTYQVSGSSIRKIGADLCNSQLHFSSLKKTTRLFYNLGTSLFFDGTIDKPLTVSKLAKQLKITRKFNDYLEREYIASQ